MGLAPQVEQLALGSARNFYLNHRVLLTTAHSMVEKWNGNEYLRNCINL
jgi:hypothetical protein